LIAKKTGRRVVVLKHKSKYSYDASRVFDLEAMGVGSMSESEFARLELVKCFREEKMRLLDYFTQDSTDLLACLSDGVLIDSSRALCTPHEWHTTDPVTGQPLHLALRRTMYRAFRLRPDLQRAWEGCVSDDNNQLKAEYVGVHIRRDDLELYRVNAECYQIERYVECARSLSHPGKRILCTDDRALVHRLRVEADMHTIDIPREFRNGLEAVFDFLVLSNATHIVGTFSSSFSFEAALYGDRVRKLDTVGWKRSIDHVPHICQLFPKGGGDSVSRILFWSIVGVFLLLAAASGVLMWHTGTTKKSNSKSKSVGIIWALLIFFALLLVASLVWAPIMRYFLMFDQLHHTLVWP